MENRELKFIEIISKTLSDNSYLGDDCAYLADFGLCVSADSLVEDVHFSFKTITPYLLGKKALKVNISDILASGAKPKYATICISGKLDEDFIKEFYTGLNEAALEFDVKIIGGDLVGGEKISISICVFGDIKNRNISSRKNAKDGYIVALCGNFGASAQGFLQLSKDKALKNEFTKAHLEPKLYQDVSKEIATKAQKPYAMCDSSDGLINSLEWIARQSGVGFDIEFEKIPKLDNTPLNDVLFGGEDYSLVCVLAQDDYEKINSPKLKKVGYATKTLGVRVDGLDVKNMQREEFLHFD